MTMIVLINLTGLLLILGIIWWFWMGHKKNENFSDQDIIDIKVDGGAYTPGVITVKQKPVIKLRFLRKDPSPCAAYVLFDELKLSQQLQLNQATIMELLDVPRGEYHFACEMNMYRGRLIVE